MHSSRTWITVLAVLLAVATGNITGNITAAESAAKARLQSIGPLAFGPDGVLFAADSRQAAIFAIATGDTKEASEGGKGPAVENVDQKIAALLGTVADGIQIEDVVVNPTLRDLVRRGIARPWPRGNPGAGDRQPSGKALDFRLGEGHPFEGRAPEPARAGRSRSTKTSAPPTGDHRSGVQRRQGHRRRTLERGILVQPAHDSLPV